MDFTYVIIGAVLLALLWALARRGETRRLRRMGLGDADAERRGAGAANQAWSQQYGGSASSGYQGAPKAGGFGGGGGV